MAQNDKSRLEALATRPVGRLLWEYSLPSVVGMLVMALYNVVDRVFIGQCVGPDAIAGLAVTFPLMNLATALGVLIGVGSSARISIVLGAGKKEEASRILGNAWTLTIINGLAYIAVFIIFIDELLLMFGASRATLPYARSYMLVLMPGLLLTNIAFSFNNVMRASGYPKKAMITMLIGAIVNIVLDPLFIIVFDWGIAGAAVATDIAMALSALFVVLHFCKPDVSLPFRRGIYGLKLKIVWAIITIGAAPALVNAAGSAVNALANRALLFHGTDRDIAAAGVMATYASLLVTIVLGLCQGMQPVIGYNYGAGKLDRLNRAYWLAVICATVVTGIGGLYGVFFPASIGRLFSSDPDLIAATDRALSTCLIAFPFVGFQVISTAFFQSIGNATESIIVGLLRQVIFMIPLLIFLPRTFGLDGVWMSFPISDVIATAITASLIIWQFRRLKGLRLRV